MTRVDTARRAVHKFQNKVFQGKIFTRHRSDIYLFATTAGSPLAFIDMRMLTKTLVWTTLRFSFANVLTSFRRTKRHIMQCALSVSFIDAFNGNSL